MGSVLATSSSGGGSGSGSSVRAARGPGWTDIRDHFTATVPSGFEDWSALQLAVRSGASGVYVPSDRTYLLNRFVFPDTDGVKILGDGPSLTNGTRFTATGGFSPLVLGVQDAVRNIAAGDGTVIDSTYRVDLFGNLDASLASTPGVRWGYRTHGDSIICFPWGPFRVGPPWVACDYLCVSYAINMATLVVSPGNGAIMAMTTQNGWAPFNFTYNASTKVFGFAFTTKDMVQRFLSIPDRNATGWVEVTFQVDLANGAAQGYVGLGGDRQQVAVDTSSAGAGWGAGLNQTFRDRAYGWFVIGNAAPRMNPGELSAGLAATRCGYADVTIGGLKMITSPIYSDRGPGQAMQRIDGGGVNAHSLFDNVGDPALVDFLMLNSGPADPCPRFVPTAYSAGLWLNYSQSSNYNSVSKVEVADLALLSQAGGAGVSLGLAIDFVATNCALVGGVFGAMALNIGANFSNVFRKCSFSGTESSIYQFMSLSKFEDCSIVHCGRRVAHFVGCSTIIRDFPVVASGTPEHLVLAEGLQYGGEHEWTNFGGDFETETPPTSATAEIRADSFTTGPTTLAWRNSAHASTNRSAVFIRLTGDDEQSGVQPSRLILEGLSAASYGRAFIETTGSNWRSDVTWDSEMPACPMVVNGAGNGLGNVVVTHTGYTMPPRWNRFAADAHVLRVEHPADGQFGEWRVLSAGQYGTATPPVWIGLHAQDRTRTGDALAAYFADSRWLNVRSSSLPGLFTDYERCQRLDWLFHGIVPPTSGFFLALADNPVYELPVPTGASAYEVPAFDSDGNPTGYVRKAITTSNWSTVNTSTGVGNLSSSLNYSSLPGPPTVGTLMMFDALSGGNLLGTVFVPPAVASGGNYVLASGDVTSHHGNTITPCVGAFTHTAFSAYDNALFRGGSYPAAPTLYLALSTVDATFGAGPTEPSGGGYARQAVPGSTWSVPISNGPHGDIAAVWNLTTISFTVPANNTAKSVYLMDAATAGNTLAAANLTINRAVVAGATTKTFAPGAIRFGES